jgi:putative nucleotidyltransferase with HDIG domain
LLDVVWQTVANARLFRVKGYTAVMQRLQTHSLFTAHVARIIAGHAGIAPDQAFLCGLLHDVGISGTVIAIAESSGKQAPPPIDMLWAAVDKMHVEASGRLARLWGLSPELCAVIGEHHQRADRNHFANPLVATMCMAEAIAEEYGFGVMPTDPTQPPGTGIDQNSPDQAEQAAARLNLQARLAGIRSQAQRVAELVSGPTA